MFSSSAVAETQFSPFSVLRPWPKGILILQFTRGLNMQKVGILGWRIPTSYRCCSWLEIRQFDDFIYGGMQAVDVFTACLCVMGLSAAAALNELGCFSDDLACV